jgi:hypothetical protein
MKNNPKEAVLKISEFLEEFEIKLKENNDLLLNKVIKNSTVDVMKSDMNFDILVRKGIVGDFKNHFNKEEIMLENSRYNEELDLMNEFVLHLVHNSESTV